MRAFIGLSINAPQKLAIEAWRNKAIGTHWPQQVSRKKQEFAAPKPVPPANFHVTLCFLGNIDLFQQEKLEHLLDEVQQSPFSLTLTQSGMWVGPKICVVEPEYIPEPLSALQRACSRAANMANINVSEQTYRPHVTVLRKARPETVPPALFAPNIECSFNEFHLFESRSTEHGVQYLIKQSYPLRPIASNLSVREQLRRGVD